MSTTYTNIWANSSLISYSGEWNLSTYTPLSDSATASIHYLGGGISWMGAGELGSNSIDGGIITRIDASSSAGQNYTIAGSDVDGPTRSVQDIPLPFGRHIADFVFNGVPRNFTFSGFKMSTNYTQPDNGVTLTAGHAIPADQIQYFGDTSTEPGEPTFWADNTTITYMEGSNTGFTFRFSVYGSPNATADVDYAVYFNMTEPPAPDSTIAPFDNYTQKAGTGGVIFYVGALPAGSHQILFVNKGDTPLGIQGALVHWPGNYTSDLSACFVNCTTEQLQQLAGTEFDDAGSDTGAGCKTGTSWAVVGLVVLMASGLSTL